MADAFSDYASLRIAVSEYVDHRNISAVLPRLVRMAESRLNRELRSRQQITYGTLTFLGGSAVLPSDFLEMAHLYGLNGFQFRAGPISDSQNLTTQCSRYSIDGTQIFIDGYSGDRSIVYFAKLPSLIDNNTNWLLSNYPEVYLYAVGFEAAKYLKDIELVTLTKGLLDDALKSARIDDGRARWSNTTVRVQGVNP